VGGDAGGPGARPAGWPRGIPALIWSLNLEQEIRSD
jgi:hypothetical protein